jgi:hypothetical protein
MPWWGWVLIVAGVIFIWRLIARLREGASFSEAIIDALCDWSEDLGGGGDSYDDFMD